jgi:hypothetical protein
MLVLREERSWIAEEISHELREIMGEEAFHALIKETKSPALQADIFRLEEEIVKVKDTQLLSDISHELMQYAQLVARERLSLLKKGLKEAESHEKDNRVLEILKEAKDAEKLLQWEIKIEK